MIMLFILVISCNKLRDIMGMGEARDMEYIVFRKLSKKVGGGRSYTGKQDYSLGKLEK